MKIKKKRSCSWPVEEEKLQRLANLLYLEIDRILFDIETRKDLLFRLWSKERVREPLLRVLRSRFYEIAFEQLLLLPNGINMQLDRFYNILDEFTFYVSYTEDMPQTMSIKFESYVKDLNSCSKNLITELQKLSRKL